MSIILSESADIACVNIFALIPPMEMEFFMIMSTSLSSEVTEGCPSFSLLEMLIECPVKNSQL